MANNGLLEPKPSSKTSTPNPQSSFKDNSGSKSDTPPTNPRIKPLASKPMGEDPPKVTNKPRSKLGSAKSPAKRLAASENNSNQESKRAKKKAVDSDVVVQKDLAKKTGDDTKKQLFQSLWSEDDEIVILKGKIEYTAKKRFDPLVDINAFYDFIKKLLYINVSKAQLFEKSEEVEQEVREQC
ncbi:putative transcription factor [Camellia lanceoleosa]|uniref:Transcription factor n=1 Tax=Camellia lanceoleosa TaxID=1840588 RepID=A0ACC0F6P1_9ERIC|nr:putative transcription factor [Camellia lanceoleosa]